MINFTREQKLVRFGGDEDQIYSEGYCGPEIIQFDGKITITSPVDNSVLLDETVSVMLPYDVPNAMYKLAAIVSRFNYPYYPIVTDISVAAGSLPAFIDNQSLVIVGLGEAVVFPKPETLRIYQHLFREAGARYLERMKYVKDDNRTTG